MVSAVILFAVSYLWLVFGQDLKGRKQLQNSFGNLKIEFDKFKDSAIDLFGNSEKLKKEIHNEHLSIQDSSAAVVEISSMSEKTAESAKNLEVNSKNLENTINHGETEINNLSNLLDLIKNDSDALKEVVFSSLNNLKQIQDEMNQIKSKTSLINEIVFQTKLLSFNASVEAARAGEYGKGFSVVASEIEKLSKSSGSAAQEIEVILSQSQTNAQGIIKSISANLEKATNDIIENLKNAFDKNTHVVENFNFQKKLVSQNLVLSEEILNATQEQSLGVKQISHSLNELMSSSKSISQVSEVTYSTSQSIANGSEDISKNIIELSQQLHLKVKEKVKTFDFKSAIKAHQDWKMKLLNYKQTPDGTLNSSHVCKDNQCALGKWIYNEGAQYRQALPSEYEALRESHAEFHKIAGKVIDLIHQKNELQVEKLLNPVGEFSARSEKTVELIQDIEQKISKVSAVG